MKRTATTGRRTFAASGRASKLRRASGIGAAAGSGRREAGAVAEEAGRIFAIALLHSVREQAPDRITRPDQTAVWELARTIPRYSPFTQWARRMLSGLMLKPLGLEQGRQISGSQITGKG